MATNNKAVSKTKKSTPKKEKTKPTVNFSKIKLKLKKSFSEKKPFYIIGVVIILLVIVASTFFWFNKSIFLAGTINGRLVTTPEFYSQLTKVSGEEVFDSIVREALISQEASKKGVSASTEEIDNKIKELEDQLGGKENLELALDQNNTNIEEVRKQITTQILVEKLLEDEITVSDKEVNDYIKQNKEIDPDISKEKAKEAVKSTKLNEEFTSWFEELSNNASITTYF